jgi:hypothetical protein
MESPAASTTPTEKGLAGDEITAIEKPGTAPQSDAENRASLEFNPDWRFYLAFSTLAVVTLAVRIFSCYASLLVQSTLSCKKFNSPRPDTEPQEL